MSESENLHTIFIALMVALLSTLRRYGGSLIAEYLAMELTSSAEQKGWALKFYAYEVSDRLPPGDPGACAAIYKEMLSVAMKRIARIIGQRAVKTTVERVFAQMDAESAELGRKHGFTDLLEREVLL
jgi:hypothetical protein